MSRKKPTIGDVARHAGVSTATVSNVLHGKTDLYAPETEDRVWRSVRALGYRPNQLARSLARGLTHTLGFVLERHHGMRLTRNPYAATVLDGFIEYAVPHHYQVKIIALTTEDPNEYAAALEDGTVDAFALLAPVQNSPMIPWALNATKPYVMIGSWFPNEPTILSIDSDNEQAMYDLVEWLIGQGHRRIGFIRGPYNHPSAIQRLAGYKRALADTGVQIREEWVVGEAYSMEEGQKGAQKLLALEPRPTAIIGGADVSALGAIEACWMSGVPVPGEVSVVGFDDIEAAPLSQPALTTVRQPMYEMGMLAAQLLIEQLLNETRLTGPIMIPTEFIERGSARPWEPLSSKGAAEIR